MVKDRFLGDQVAKSFFLKRLWILIITADYLIGRWSR